MYYGKDIGGRLARASLCTRQNVLPIQCQRDGFGLDESGFGEFFLDEGLSQTRVQVEVFKTGISGIALFYHRDVIGGRGIVDVEFPFHG